MNVFASGGGLSGPRGLVFHGSNVFVSSFGSDQVIEYNATTGAFVTAFASGGGLIEPSGLIFGPDGNLYVSSLGGGQVLRYNGTTGAFIGVFASGGGLSSPRGLLFGSDGNLYVSSGDTNNVLRYNGTTGAFVNVFATGGINTAGYIAIDPQAIYLTPEPSTFFFSAAGLLLFISRLKRRAGL
jgi:DNA-binding beta-propeller fold protein YncE